MCMFCLHLPSDDFDDKGEKIIKSILIKVKRETVKQLLSAF